MGDYRLEPPEEPEWVDIVDEIPRLDESYASLGEAMSDIKYTMEQAEKALAELERIQNGGSYD